MAFRPGPFLSPQALAALAGRVERRSLRALTEVLARVRSGLPLAEVERALLAQNLDAAIEAIGLDPVTNALHAASEAASVVRADAWSAQVGALPAAARRQPDVALSLAAHAAANPAALEAVKRQTLRRIQDISQETETAIRDSLTRGLAAGSPPRQVAREIRAVIGLNRRQSLALDRFRARLVADAVDPATLERRVLRQGDQMVRQRAVSIARTETMTALNEGTRLQRERLAAEGTIGRDDFEQEWVVAHDERLCPQCAPMDGVRVPIGAPFDTVLGAMAGPPLHPNCRCTTRAVLKDQAPSEAPNLAQTLFGL